MAMPEFLRSRMRPVIRVEYPARKEIEKIIEAHHPRLHERVAPLIETFWRLWDLHQPENGHPPTPRDVIYVFSLAINWADYEAQGQRIPLDDAEHHVSLRSADSQVTITPEHLTRAFREILHQRQGTGT
jgi:MoxR-like ATPase